MKKYTNKIMLAVFILTAAFLAIGITVDFQVKYHKNPKQFDVKQYPYEYEESSYSMTIGNDSEDSVTNE